MASLVTTQALGMIGATTILGRKNQLKDQLLITVMVGLAAMMPKMMDLIISMGVHLIIKLLVIMKVRCSLDRSRLSLRFVNYAIFLGRFKG